MFERLIDDTGVETVYTNINKSKVADSEDTAKKDLSRLSSPTEKRHASEAVYELLGDFLFDKINFISHPFSQVTQTDGTAGWVDTATFGGSSRLTDTAEGRFLDVGRKSRMKCQFYITNPTKAVGYILSPTVYDSFASLNSFESMSQFRSYIGIKVDKGLITIAVKEYNKSEVLYPTSYLFTDAGSTDTVTLEIQYFGSYSKVLINSELAGTFQTDFGVGKVATKTYLPLLSPVKSLDGSSVNITLENYQFLQDK